MKTGILFRTVLATVLALPAARAQEATATPAEGSRPPSEAQAEATPAPSPPSRASGSRRDPFRTLVVPKKDDDVERTPSCVEPGKRGLLIGQLQVQGIARGIDGSWIAVVDNKTNRAYFLREKDELCNGVVSKINPGSVVFLEEGTDSLGRRGTEEVVKELPPD